MGNCSIYFNNNGGGSQDYWFWEFGNGQTAYGNPVTHTFSTPGTYNVCLTVSDSGYTCIDTICQNVTVIPIRYYRKMMPQCIPFNKMQKSCSTFGTALLFQRIDTLLHRIRSHVFNGICQESFGVFGIMNSTAIFPYAGLENKHACKVTFGNRRVFGVG